MRHGASVVVVHCSWWILSPISWLFPLEKFLVTSSYFRYPILFQTASWFQFLVSYFLIVSDEIMAAESIDTNCMTLTRYFYQQFWIGIYHRYRVENRKDTVVPQALSLTYIPKSIFQCKILIWSNQVHPGWAEEARQGWDRWEWKFISCWPNKDQF